MRKVSQTPAPEAIESLIGKELYQIWNTLCLLIEQKYEMEQLWNSSGENGYMNINTGEVVKLSVLYTLKKISLALWLYYAKENVINLKCNENYFQKKYKHSMMKQRLTMTANRLCLS